MIRLMDDSPVDRSWWTLSVRVTLIAVFVDVLELRYQWISLIPLAVELSVVRDGRSHLRTRSGRACLRHFTRLGLAPSGIRLFGCAGVLRVTRERRRGRQ